MLINCNPRNAFKFFIKYVIILLLIFNIINFFYININIITNMTFFKIIIWFVLNIYYIVYIIIPLTIKIIIILYTVVIQLLHAFIIYTIENISLTLNYSEDISNLNLCNLFHFIFIKLILILSDIFNFKNIISMDEIYIYTYITVLNAYFISSDNSTILFEIIILSFTDIVNIAFNTVEYLTFELLHICYIIIYILFEEFTPATSLYVIEHRFLLKCILIDDYDSLLLYAANILEKFTFGLQSLFFLIILYQLFLVIYYIFNKIINYKIVFITLNLIFFIQLHAALFLFILNKQILFDLTTAMNSDFILYKIISLKFDRLAWVFIFTVYTISFFVHLYQFFYLYDMPNKERFLIKLNVFILSMLGVVISNNWLSLLFSWEVLGQSSFFLIAYYKNKPSSLKSALKAFFYNKISDITLILAFVLYFKLYQTVSFITVIKDSYYNSYIGSFILVTALAKSAQFIFYFWLPDSMEAPIPASALIHSATLVSAGIYLAIRFKLLIENNNGARYILLFSTPTSMVLFSIIALNQTDIKKLLAYSTISNCAFIYLILLTKNYELVQLYFILHGLIKSLSFITAGSLIQKQNHFQDFRKWFIVNRHEYGLLILLIVMLLILATIPATLLYNIKTNVTTMDTTNIYQTIFLQLTLLIYTVNSYLYGIKLLTCVLNKSHLYEKIQFSKLEYSLWLKKSIKIILIYCVYFTSILIILYMQNLVNIQLIYSWQWLLLLLLLILILIYCNLKNKFWIMYIIIQIIQLLILFI